MATTEELGSDFHCIDDLDQSWSVVSGRINLAHGSARRLGTGRGQLFYDLDYGYDVRSRIGAGAVESITSARVAHEVTKDERVQDAGARVKFIRYEEATGTEQKESLTIKLAITDAEGPFSLTLGVDDVSVKLLETEF